MQTKNCVKCGECKVTSDFSKDRTRSDGLHPYCSSCRKKEKKEAYYADVEKHRLQKRISHHKHKERTNEKQRMFSATDEGKSLQRRKHLLARYGLTLETYDDLRHAQDYRCMICKDHESIIRKGNSARSDTALHVDHCHTTGEVRGLLCTNCNVLLGKAKDNIDLLKTAIEYLERKMI
jgi:hypothetical protein